MLVYGDATQRDTIAGKLARVAGALDRAGATPAGLQRHGVLVEALIDAGELAQGIADDDFHRDGGIDRASPRGDAALALTMAVARRCAASWTSGFADCGAPLADEIGRCAALLGDGEIEVKQPEGYAFYAVYPESYLASALRLGGRRWQVLAVRSIGTSLGCMVAEGLGAAAPISVRPLGDPFARRIAADPARIDRAADAYAIVDEGPGLSGSSFAAVARWLLDAGVAEERLHFFAGHRQGPGARADAATLALWRRAQASERVHVTTFDELVLHAGAPGHRLDAWLAPLTGPLQAPLREIGGGAWRDLQARSDGLSPPVHPWQERRKFLAFARGGRWLVKFNGLGSTGLRKLAIARELAGAGFTAQPLGSCHGFLVERWHDGALPLDEASSPGARAALLERIAAYLGFRARSFAARADSGASIRTLREMGRRNSEEALGPSAAGAWDRWAEHEADLADAVRRVATDNRMHRWEWLRCAQTFVKTDALDHHVAHDLVGCQDIAWDIVGATAELDLDAGEERELTARVGELARVPVAGPLLRFYAGCYPAFQLGYYDDAMRSAGNDDDAGRLQAARDRYAERLRRVLESGTFKPTR